MPASAAPAGTRPARTLAADGPERGDRFHFIARQIERLDDRAFAALLAWLDGYADSRWAGRCAMDGGAVAPPPATAVSERRTGAVATSSHRREGADPVLSRATSAGDWPALEWIACEPAVPRGYAPSRAQR
jgi:hypothetical protein